MDETIEQRVDRLEYWRNGNGAKGAEARLQEVEKWKEEFVTQEAVTGIISDAAKAAAHQIVNNARSRDKTVTERIKAFGPYFIALLAFLGGLLGGKVVGG